MSALREGGDGELFRDETTLQVQRFSGIAAKAPSRIEKKIATLDFVSLPPDLRKFIIDAIRLIHLMGGSQGDFYIPDPLSARRVILNEDLFVRARIVLTQLASILSAAMNHILVKENFDTAPLTACCVLFKVERNSIKHVTNGYDVTAVFYRDGNVCKPHNQETVLSQSPYADQREEAAKVALGGILNVQETIPVFSNLPAHSSSLVGKLRECHRRYQDVTCKR